MGCDIIQVIEKSIKDLKPYPKNAKKHSDEQITKVSNSIKSFGWQQPLVISNNNDIIIGHARLLAAKRLKMNTVPCVIAEGLTQEEMNALRLADNKTNESEWDIDILKDELSNIFDMNMADFGFDINSISAIQQDDINTIEITEDEYDKEPPIIPKTKRGNVYKLGKHRLVCGDSTNVNDVDLLMNKQKGRILFTSPPYSDMRTYGGDKDISIDNLINFIDVYKKYTDYQCINLGIQRKEYEIVQYWDAYIEKAKQCGYKLLAWNIWNQINSGSIGLQHAFFPICHEWVFVFGTKYYDINCTWDKKDRDLRTVNTRRQKDGSTKYSAVGDTSNPLKKMTSVLSLYSEKGPIREDHPAVFPIGFPAEYVKAMTDINDIVIEPFGGSGSTLIACEQLNRACYIMELDCGYCDLIVDRWEEFTKQKAELIKGV